MTGVFEFPEGKSRRDILRALGATAVGAFAGGVLSGEDAQASHGTLNAGSTDVTTPAVHGSHATSGAGVEGTSASGFGVIGRSNPNTSIGVLGESTSGTAVRGNSGSGYGVHGNSTSHYGVLGESSGNGAPGVYGYHYSNGPGVRGASIAGIGVDAEAQIGRAHV